MIIGCFPPIQHFAPVRRQFEFICRLAFDCADLIDNNDGASPILAPEYGSSALLSLEFLPEIILDTVDGTNSEAAKAIPRAHRSPQTPANNKPPASSPPTKSNKIAKGIRLLCTFPCALVASQRTPVT